MKHRLGIDDRIVAELAQPVTTHETTLPPWMTATDIPGVPKASSAFAAKRSKTSSGSPPQLVSSECNTTSKIVVVASARCRINRMFGTNIFD
jgi:hypothetical protein